MMYEKEGGDDCASLYSDWYVIRTSTMELGYEITGGFSVYLFCFLVFMMIYATTLRKKINTFYELILIITFACYLTLVVEKTLMPIPLNRIQILNMQRRVPLINWYNLMPLKNALNHSTDRMQSVLNVILLIPFGILYPLIVKKTNICKVTLQAFFLSLLIESTQLFMSFIFKANYWFSDVNDLIFNTIGGFIGYILIGLALRIYYACLSVYHANSREHT